MAIRFQRRESITLLGGAAVWPLAARAQQPAGTYRIGVLETLPPDRNKANFGALLRGLHKHGYIEGQNLQIEYRSADGHDDRFPALVANSIGRRRPHRDPWHTRRKIGESRDRDDSYRDGGDR